MPSPVGHMLGGVAAGWLVGGAPWPTSTSDTRAAAWRRTSLGYALLGAAPDLDLLTGTHSTYTHSLGAVAITVGLVWLVARRRRFALACGAAIGSHVLLDWLGADTTPPLGIMALWPLSSGYFLSPVPVFMAISRRYWQPHFYVHNLFALLRELAILVPLVLAIGWWRRRDARDHPPPSSGSQ